MKPRCTVSNALEIQVFLSYLGDAYLFSSYRKHASAFAHALYVFVCHACYCLVIILLRISKSSDMNSRHVYTESPEHMTSSYYNSES